MKLSGMIKIFAFHEEKLKFKFSKQGCFFLVGFISTEYKKLKS